MKANLIDPDRSGYEALFQGVDAVVHLGYRRRSGEAIDHFFHEKENVEMAYNVLRTSYDSGVGRVAMASSNHAADWYEHALIHRRKMEVLDPYALPLSDNFYGWAKATYEHMGFVFACGFPGFQDLAGREYHTSGLTPGRRMGAVMVRIGAPRELRLGNYEGAPANFKRDLGAYISPRDITQLFVKSIETPNIDNEHGIPWQVVYGISNNTRAFWSPGQRAQRTGLRARGRRGGQVRRGRRRVQGERWRGRRIRQGRPASGDGPIAPDCPPAALASRPAHPVQH